MNYAGPASPLPRIRAGQVIIAVAAGLVAAGALAWVLGTAFLPLEGPLAEPLLFVIVFAIPLAAGGWTAWRVLRVLRLLRFGRFEEE